MTITIDLKRVMRFANRHKEAIFVACVAGLVLRKAYVVNDSMSNFIISTGQEHDYCHFKQK
jgi:hypothetical protein